MMPAETPDGVLRVHCYRYYRRLKRAGGLDRLAEHLANDKSGRWVRHKAKGVDAVLRLLERSVENWFVTPSRRGRIARDLNFADSHDIHSKLLLAFLYEHKPPDVGQLAPMSETRAASIALYKRLSDDLRACASKREAHEPETAES